MPLLLEGTTAACPGSWETWAESWDNATAPWGCDTAANSTQAGMTLFLAGSPIGLEEEGLNLFLDSPTTNAVTLYMQGQAAELDEGVPLVVGGAAPIQQGVDLSVPVVVAEYEAGVSLYTRGW